jgi:cell division protein FtsB
MARRRPSIRRVRLRRALLAAGLAVVAFLYYRPLRSYVDTKRELAQRAAEVHGLRQQKQKLERQLKASGTPESLARSARTELSLVKPGEHLFIVKGIDVWRREHRPAGTK